MEGIGAEQYASLRLGHFHDLFYGKINGAGGLQRRAEDSGGDYDRYRLRLKFSCRLMRIWSYSSVSTEPWSNCRPTTKKNISEIR